MTSNNRGRLTVDINGNWRLYTNTLPADATPIGTVKRKRGDGALVRMEKTGVYAQVNNGVILPLDGRKVAAALGTIGRPKTLDETKNRTARLTNEEFEFAKKTGDGSFSAGVRLAIKKMRDTM